MYGKYFKSTFTGSMVGAGPDVFAIWGYVVANTVQGKVELNPILLAAIIGMPIDRVQKALDYLQSPDPKSRSKEHDGRRLLKEGEYQYCIPNFFTYHNITNNAELREYNRTKQAEHREKTRPLTDAEFETFWQAYPRKQGRQPARNAWAKIQGVLLQTLLDALEHQKKSAQWTKDGGAFVPMAATWLNQQRWTDNLPPASATTGTPRKLYPAEALKLLAELRDQRTKNWNRNAFNGTIPETKPEAQKLHMNLTKRIKEIESDLAGR